jgi:hypothetical protein
MKSKLFTPVAQGQIASCTVFGQFERGYLKVKLNGAYVSVRPDDHPDVHDEEREVFAFPSGKSFDVWTDPPWKATDELRVELYDAQRKLVDTHITTVIPGA